MRRGLVLAHRYAGLALAGVLAIIALTGAAIAFERELDALLNPGLHRVPAAPPLPLDSLAERVEAAHPGLRVAAIEPAAEPGRSAQLRVAPRDPSRPADIDEMFVDPASGAVLGQRLWGACCLAPEQLVPFLYRLHYTLLLPERAVAAVMGGIAVLWLADSAVGLALAWPRTRRGWRQTLGVKRDAGRYRLVFDLHRAGGVWLWLPILVLAVTSIAITLRVPFFKPLVAAATAVTPDIAELPVPPAEGNRTVTFQQAADIALSHAPDHIIGARVVYLSHAPGRHLYRVGVADRTGDPRDGLGPSWVHVDDRTGIVRSVLVPGGGTAGDTVMEAQLPLHSGRILGLPGRIVACVTGLAVAGLSVTGVLVWARKRRARLARR